MERRRVEKRWRMEGGEEREETGETEGGNGAEESGETMEDGGRDEGGRDDDRRDDERRDDGGMGWVTVQYGGVTLEVAPRNDLGCLTGGVVGG